MLSRLIAQIFSRSSRPNPSPAQGDTDDGTAHATQPERAAPHSARLPANASAAQWHEHAAGLVGTGELEEAAACYQEAIHAHPGNAPLRVNASNVLKGLGRTAEARQHLEYAVQLAPELPGVWYNLGILLQETWWLEEALDAFEQAFRLERARGPTELLRTIARSIGLVLQRSGNWRRARDFLEEISGLFAPFAAEFERIALFTWIEDPVSSPKEKLHAFVRWAEKYADPMLPQAAGYTNSRLPERPLKIGYVSGDFRTHAVSIFFEPLLRHHDPGQFLVYCYNNSPNTDSTTSRLQSYAARWRPVSALSDHELVKAIRDDEIDILVDLSGHTAYNRLDAFARKPAPIQATWVGFGLTTGMRAIDYRISDCHVSPPGISDAWHRERILRLPDSQWCYSAPQVSPPLSRLPMLSNRHVSFGSFNQVDKLNDEVFAAWAEILRSLPGSRLTMVGIPMGRYRDKLLFKWRELGIDPFRISLHSHVKRERFLAIHDQVDIAFDPFPYNGGTATCESLWMGVPVLTMKGASCLSLAGVSLLTAAGLPDWIANSREDYVRLAIAKASDPEALSTLRENMRARLLASALMDGARFTRNFEAALRGAWREWCALQPAGV